MNYAYIRVSTDHQNTQNQRLEIENFCKKNDLVIDFWIDEKVSGTTKPEKRQLGNLLCMTKSNDIVICSELSRLGRSLMMIMNVLNQFLEKNVKVWTIKDGFRLGEDIQSKVLAFAFGISAEIERQLISERTKNGLYRAKTEGKHIGRPHKRKSSHYKLSKYNKLIEKSLSEGKSLNSLAQELNVCWATLKNHCKRENFI